MVFSIRVAPVYVLQWTIIFNSSIVMSPIPGTVKGANRNTFQDDFFRIPLQLHHFHILSLN